MRLHTVAHASFFLETFLDGRLFYLETTKSLFRPCFTDGIAAQCLYDVLHPLDNSKTLARLHAVAADLVLASRTRSLPGG